MIRVSGFIGLVAAFEGLCLTGCQSAQSQNVSEVIRTNVVDSKPASTTARPQEPPAAQSEQFDTSSSADVFPLDSGDRWSYSSTTSMDGTPVGISQTVTMKAFSKTFFGFTGGRLVLEENGILQDQQGWVVKGNKLVELSAGVKNVPFNPPQVLALLPLKQGSIIYWKGTGVTPSGSKGLMYSVNSVGHKQEVDTGLGKVQAIPITSRTSFKWNGVPSLANAALFLTPGGGIVRYDMVINSGGHVLHNVLELKTRLIKS